MSEPKRILITGGAQGLGIEIAKSLSINGHHIIVFDKISFADINPESKKYIDEYYQIDLLDKSSVFDKLNDILSKKNSIDVLINNAAARVFKFFPDFSAIEIENTLRLNFEIPLQLICALLPSMQQSGYGRIVNISSISGLSGYKQGSLYCSTKSALIQFTESLGIDLCSQKSGITANVICPDSFCTLEGEKLKDYNLILGGVTKIVHKIIDSSVNGEVFLILPASRRVYEFLRMIKIHFIRVTGFTQK